MDGKVRIEEAGLTFTSFLLIPLYTKQGFAAGPCVDWSVTTCYRLLNIFNIHPLPPLSPIEALFYFLLAPEFSFRGHNLNQPVVVSATWYLLKIGICPTWWWIFLFWGPVGTFSCFVIVSSWGIWKVSQRDDSVKGSLAAHITRKNLEAGFRTNPWKLYPFFGLTCLEVGLLITLNAYPRYK